MRPYLHLLLLLLSTGIFAQNNDSIKFQPRGYLAFEMGPGIPLGGYSPASKSAYYGYALIGKEWSFSGGIPIKKSHFGIAITYLNYRNNFDNESYASNLSQHAIGPPWSSNYYTGEIFMAGLLYTIPRKNISYDFRLLGGWGWATFPYANYWYPDPNNYPYGKFDVTVNPSSGHEIAIDFGGQVRIPIIEEKIICLTLGVDFYYADPEISTIETIERSTSTGYASTESSITNHIATLFVSFTAGIAFQISGHYFTPVNQHGDFE